MEVVEDWAQERVRRRVGPRAGRFTGEVHERVRVFSSADLGEGGLDSNHSLGNHVPWRVEVQANGCCRANSVGSGAELSLQTELEA